VTFSGWNDTYCEQGSRALQSIVKSPPRTEYRYPIFLLSSRYLSEDPTKPWGRRGNINIIETKAARSTAFRHEITLKTKKWTVIFSVGWRGEDTNYRLLSADGASTLCIAPQCPHAEWASSSHDIRMCKSVLAFCRVAPPSFAFLIRMLSSFKYLSIACSTNTPCMSK